jgi:two-component system sensor histidine kinase GlrK
MFSLSRYSFRQLLLVAFLLIATLLSAASLRGLFTLEALLRQSGDGARQAVAMAGAAQLLAERSIAMERAARQYLVLDDPVLRQRYDDAAREAAEVLTRLDAERIPAVVNWRATLDIIQIQLKGPAVTREPALTEAFRELSNLNATVSEQVRAATEAQNQQLLSELETRRAQLGQQLLLAIALTIALALSFGLWLARPLKRIETAIIGLGENRLDEQIEIRGPIDVRLVGRRLEWLRLRLAELDADKARFLRHVSHELKTPLAALREGVALLEDGVTGTLTDNQREVARILNHNTHVLQKQIEDLLRFNAAAFEARRLQRRRVELTDLVAKCIAEQRLQWQARRLKVTVGGRPLWVEIDPDKMSTVIGNLLSNAIRFSPPDATIHFSVSLLPGRACIDIVDEGPGVAAADRARVFEPFYRGENQPADAVRGSGIGLSIVYEYVTAHGGQIELLPDGPGAQFHIELPHAS